MNKHHWTDIMLQVSDSNGGPCRTRTYNHRIKRQSSGFYPSPWERIYVRNPARFLTAEIRAEKGRRYTVFLALCATLSGCAALPDTVRPEFEHMSHLTQHRPFTDTPTDYGADLVNLMLHWDLGRWQLEMGEGFAVDHGYPASVGEILGPREQFTFRVGYSFRVPK